MNVSLVADYAFGSMISAFMIGAVGSLVCKKCDRYSNWWAHVWAALGSLAGIVWGVIGVFLDGGWYKSIETAMPLFSVSIKLDELSAFFVLLISLIGLVSALYGGGYMKKFYKRYQLAGFGFFYNIFILSLILVVTSWNGFYFLFVWELMALVSYFLVSFEHRNAENVNSGFSYLLMTHLASAFILFSFLLLFRYVGSFDFTAIKESAAHIPDSVKNIVFIFSLIGFGTKAGVIPLHIWLPRAHPAAPSHVSAIMSGVMIKTGVYMLIRMFIDIIPGAPVWWGWVILLLGAVSSILGVLYALGEHDLKRLLAYHSVENIGIILMGLGSAFIFYALELPTLAFVGLVAALFHVMNHAVFKALLFLGAGSVFLATHTRNIEEYGGLVKKMPYTAFFFFIGSAAISALPPLNGFASEWLTFQSLFVGINDSFSIFTICLFLIAITSLAFTGGLAAACFVKAFGTAFLGKSRSKESSNASESPSLLRVSMGILALLCIVLGIFASPVTSGLAHVAGSVEWFRGGEYSIITRPNIHVSGTGASLSLERVALGGIGIGVLAVAVLWLIGKGRKKKTYNTWDCGSTLTPRMEITATGFSRSLMVIFQGLLRSTRQTEIEYQDANIRYFAKSRTVTLGMQNVYGKYIYAPLETGIAHVSNFVKKLHSGNIHLYLLYIFITVLVLLVWATQ